MPYILMTFLSGNIPAEYLYLQDNDLVGTVPDEIGKLTALSKF